MIYVKSIHDKLKEFKKDLQRSLVDELIIDIILTLNNCNNLKTTSSCSGRIAILCFNELEKKHYSKKSSFHSIPSRKGFIKTLTRIFRRCKGLLIVRVRGFIVDIETCIGIIRDLLRKLSFKTAMIKPTKNRNKIIVELRSPIVLDIPLLKFSGGDIYEVVIKYLWRNFIDLNIFRNILWYTISEEFGDDEATLK